MTIDGPAGYIVMALVAVVVFVGLIGGLVWVYSAQSAKRRKSGAAVTARTKEHDGN